MTEKDLKLIEEAKSIRDCEEWPHVEELSKQAETEEARDIIKRLANSLYYKSEYEYI